MISRNPRNNYYDFQKVTLEDLNLEQEAVQNGLALSQEMSSGNGVLLGFPQERVIFDSTLLTAEQSGYIATDTFDGRGILAEPFDISDLSGGSQISVEISGARLTGVANLIVTIIGKIFDGTLKYEHLIFPNNGTMVSENHYKEVTNILFQNAFGNLDDSVDGYASINTVGEVTVDGVQYTEGRILVTEASSYKVSLDLISNSWTKEPDMIFRDYKVYFEGMLLEDVITEAIGDSNDINELDINVSVAQTRTFEEDASTELIYAQKFQMVGNNIQKISLALGLEEGDDWSGSLVVSIVPLLTDTDDLSGFLPDNEIEFDPNTIPLEEVSVSQEDLADRGIVLTEKTQIVDFVFTDAQISNPSLSTLIDGGWYAITIRRTGSSATGTLFFDEARNDDEFERRLSIFSNAQWTDIPDSTMWFMIWSDSVKVSAGIAFDQGVRLPIMKTKLGSNGVTEQHIVQDIDLVDVSESLENYLIVQKDVEFSKEESHPRTGDPQYTIKEDVPKFSFVTQDELEAILVDAPETVVLARVKDNNARGNPEIIETGIRYPGLVLGNVINIVNPGSDLLQQNVIGSIITPNVSKPQFKYRITSQETVTELLGDLNNDDVIDVFDANRIVELDGYHTYIETTSSYTSAQQRSVLFSKELSIFEVIKANLSAGDGDGYEIGSDDLDAVNDFIDNGTAFPIGETSITYVRLTVENILNSKECYDVNNVSILKLEEIDPDFTDESVFSETTYLAGEIEFLPVWTADQVEITDLRRYVASVFSDFSIDNLTSDPETGGQNNLFIPGDTYLYGNVLNLDASFHKLDFEKNIIEIELPQGNTEGEINIFSEYVSGQMKFSDGSFVSSSAINNGQVKFSVVLSSHVKNVSDIGDGYTDDGYLDFDGYNDGYGTNADEAIGTYIDHNTGLLRIRAFNIVYNPLLPEIRTRISIEVMLKKAGFANSNVFVTAAQLSEKLQPF